MKQFSEKEARAVELLRNAGIDGRDGLPEDLFLLISGLIPLPNVDLLVVNKRGQLLLTRRNDRFFEKSWHIPGGCMRYGETFEHRVQETAKRELGCSVSMEPQPLAVRSVVRGPNLQQPHPNERGHTVAILFRCSLPDGYEIDNGTRTEEDNGYCKWFTYLPDDFMSIQNVYLDVLHPWIAKENTK